MKQYISKDGKISLGYKIKSSGNITDNVVVLEYKNADYELVKPVKEIYTIVPTSTALHVFDLSTGFVSLLTIDDCDINEAYSCVSDYAAYDVYKNSGDFHLQLVANVLEAQGDNALDLAREMLKSASLNKRIENLGITTGSKKEFLLKTLIENTGGGRDYKDFIRSTVESHILKAEVGPYSTFMIPLIQAIASSIL